MSDELSKDRKENIRLKILLTMAGCICFNDVKKIRECPVHNNADAMGGLESLKKEIESIAPEGYLDMRKQP